MPQSAGSGLKLIARAGRDKNRHSLWTFRCDCGREVVLRKDKAAQRDTCGDCGHVPAPIPAPVAAPPAAVDPNIHPTPESLPEAAASPECGSIEWYRAEILRKESTLRVLETQASNLEDLVRMDGGVMPSDGVVEPNDKIWNRATGMIAKLRRELSKLKKDLTRLEAAKAAPKNAREAYAQKIAALKSNQGTKP